MSMSREQDDRMGTVIAVNKHRFTGSLGHTPQCNAVA